MVEFQQINTIGTTDAWKTVWRTKEPLLIVDGKIKFFDKTTGAYFELPVKQVKGRGTHDAKELIGTKLNEKYHLPMLNALLEQPEKKHQKFDEIILLTKAWLFNNTDFVPSKFIQNNWLRPCSEFLALGIIYKSGGLYHLDVSKAKEVKDKGIFA